MTTARKPDQEHELSKDLYFGDAYFEWRQLSSMCQQLIEINKLKPKTLLEIGKGNGFVCDFLKKSGIEVTTLDINPNLEPDIVGSITDLDQYFSPGQFDCILCSEVLEHIPLVHFEPSLKQMAAISRKNVVITLPVFQRSLLDFQARFKIGKMKHREMGLRIPFKGKGMFAGHHWEINHSKETKISRNKRARSSNSKNNRKRYHPLHPYW